MKSIEQYIFKYECWAKSIKKQIIDWYYRLFYVNGVLTIKKKF